MVHCVVSKTVENRDMVRPIQQRANKKSYASCPVVILAMASSDR